MVLAVDIIQALTNYRINITCPKCNGKGQTKENDRGNSFFQTCSRCKGIKTITQKIKFQFEDE